MTSRSVYRAYPDNKIVFWKLWIFCDQRHVIHRRYWGFVDVNAWDFEICCFWCLHHVCILWNLCRFSKHCFHD